MAAGATYEKIQTNTLSSAQSDLTFTSISGSYTDLIIIVNAGCSSNGDVLYMQFNGDTSTNYSNTVMFGGGSTATSDRSSGVTYISLSQGAGLGTGASAYNCISQINNYSNATTFKTVLTRNNIPSAGLYPATEFRGSLWRATPAAITSIRFYTSAGNIVAGSTFTLYGIAAA